MSNDRGFASVLGAPSRRGFLAMATAVGAAACAPAAAPGSLGAPAGSGAPAASGSLGAPVGSGTPAAATPAWQKEWDELVAAAKREGKLSVLTGAGAGYRAALTAFEAVFPGIAIEHEGPGSMGPFSQKIVQERKAGVFDRDVAQIPIISALSVLKPEGAWAPLRPAIMRPDALDDKAWQGGFDHGWLDVEKKLAYGWAHEKYSGAFRNTSLMPDGAVKNLKDLLDPKWKGKFIFGDPPTYGGTYPMATAMRLRAGNETLKQLFVDQAPVSSRDFRQIAEALVRGTHALGTTSVQFIDEFRSQGLGSNVKEFFDVPEMLMIREDAVFLFDRAPHPNAAKLFINWILTRDGQKAWSEGAKQNSRRADVAPVNPDKQILPGDDKRYFQINREENLPKLVETQNLLKELLK